MFKENPVFAFLALGGAFFLLFLLAKYGRRLTKWTLLFVFGLFVVLIAFGVMRGLFKQWFGI